MLSEIVDNYLFPDKTVISVELDYIVQVVNSTLKCRVKRKPDLKKTKLKRTLLRLSTLSNIW